MRLLTKSPVLALRQIVAVAPNPGLYYEGASDFCPFAII
jgi:hypothetical protein